MSCALLIAVASASLWAGTVAAAAAEGEQPRMKILFLCSGNSCRSQMAEGWVRHLKTETFEAYSAGVKPKGSVDPLAIRAMAECDVDISSHTSKHTNALPDVRFDWVVTVCAPAAEECPFYPGAQVIHIAFDDPPAMAKLATSDEEVMACYRFIRDEIRAFVENMPAILKVYAAQKSQ